MASLGVGVQVRQVRHGLAGGGRLGGGGLGALLVGLRRRGRVDVLRVLRRGRAGVRRGRRPVQQLRVYFILLRLFHFNLLLYFYY